jgi:hypothetical protein
MTEKDARDVEKAAKTNGDGPFCGLCLHLEMATRYAAARGLKLTVTLGNLKKDP